MQDLLVKYLSGEITAEEKVFLFSKVESDAAFRNEFLSAVNLRAMSGWLPQDGDIPESLSHLLQFKKTHSQEKGKNSYRLRTFLGYAAAICIAVLSTWVIMKSSNHEQLPEQASVMYEEFSTPAGQRARVKLHDGTVVWLNAKSILRYPNHFNSDERRVELNGEAYFEVAKNADCPFIVSTDKMNIKVLGTKFNVFAYSGDNDFSISLIEGSIDVYNPNNVNESMQMKPNEKLAIVGGKWEKTIFQNSDFLLWKDGIYAFDDMTFGEIVKKLQLYYDISIIVNNPVLEAYKFSGKFRQRDGVESLLQTLQKVRYFTYVKDTDKT